MSRFAKKMRKLGDAWRELPPESRDEALLSLTAASMLLKEGFGKLGPAAEPLLRSLIDVGLQVAIDVVRGRSGDEMISEAAAALPELQAVALAWKDEPRALPAPEEGTPDETPPAAS